MAMLFGDQRDWFFRKRRGLFLHWGLYALEGWHEQDQMRRHIPRGEYTKLSKRWNPQRFEPERWLDLAQETGMEYLVFTAKHHDGFCLFDSKHTEFKVTNTPYGHDILAELAEACSHRAFPLGIYYSVVDWRHPNYPNQGRHHELPAQPHDQPDMKKYQEYLRSQVYELCTNYGPVCSFWWDMNVEETRDPSINQMIRQLQPGCVINNRGMDEGDFGTPERDWTDHAGAPEKPVEACQSVGMESWGYRNEESYYSDRHLLRSMDRFLCSGANYLLNVGPDADGVIPEKSTALLRQLGRWYQQVGSAFPSRPELANGLARGMDLPGVPEAKMIHRGKQVYLHFPGDLPGEDVIVRPLRDLPVRAVLLNTGQTLRCANDKTPSQHLEQTGYLRVCGLPVNELANTCAVVALEFQEAPHVPDQDASVAGNDLRIR